MRQIERTSKFKKDYKRELKGQHKDTLNDVFVEVVTSLASDLALDEKYRDHSLSGEWSDHRDCHIKPDLVLIYRLENSDKLHLVRIGSHSELF
ncbi:type II toxin-antitoxin system mRNA interferase toxin, RelE/StbE family [Candidatus Kaiserbacteria bacterium]|nr:MAG: type II toxin-antitoxin system mRNA interferase toxin, RelE/StbE family [Candidatus Kaiserbacteria bacterium]